MTDAGSIGGALFAGMVKSGAAALNAKRQAINDLNVFPIPDGDTGDNMFMTIDSGAAELEKAPAAALGETAAAAARGMLLGARGNSGVILSRIFAGIARGLEGTEEADLPTLSRAFERGVEEAYRAVSRPVEGTLLTVYREGVAYAAKKLTPQSTPAAFFDDLIEEARRSLERSPELLDVLREAGVVDSGGAGFVCIAEGMRAALTGENKACDVGLRPAAKGPDLSLFTEDSELEFGYCTEFLLRLQRAKGDPEAFDLPGLIRWLEGIGDSVVAFRDGTAVKVHVHTRTPGRVLDHCQQFGEFLTLKIENMTLQHSETRAEDRFSAPRTPRKPFGVVAVAAGEGIKETFLSLGCDRVVEGGQSMNPSAQEFIAAFRRINADTILVFPNNGNVILTARQAADLYKEAQVRVIPSKTVGEGYAAVSMLDTSSGDADAIAAEMEEIIAGVVTGFVSPASRDAQMDGVRVKAGDYIGFCGDTVYLSVPDRREAAVGLAKALEAEKYGVMLLLCGARVPAEETEELYRVLTAAFPRCEVILIDGGQPVYDYIIILE